MKKANLFSAHNCSMFRLSLVVPFTIKALDVINCVTAYRMELTFTLTISPTGTSKI